MNKPNRNIRIDTRRRLVLDDGDVARIDVCRKDDGGDGVVFDVNGTHTFALTGDEARALAAFLREELGLK